MFLIQLLLPKTLPSGASADAAVAATRAELVADFDGLTAYERSPAQGAWRNDEGHVERDEIVMVEVVAEAFNRGWWRDYRERLERRFEQQEVHVRAMSVEIP